MTLRQRIKLKKKQRQKVAPVCDFKKVSYLAGIIVEQSSGYRCLCFLLCSLSVGVANFSFLSGTHSFLFSIGFLYKQMVPKTSSVGWKCLLMCM